MNLIDAARRDIHDITTNEDTGFAVFFVMYLSSGTVSPQIKGTSARHFMAFNTDGVKVSSLNAHVSVTEQALIMGGITVRDGNNDVVLLGKRVNVTDRGGINRDYVVVEQYPNDGLGFITLILGSAAEYTAATGNEPLDPPLNANET